MSYGVGRRRALEEVAEDLPFWEYHAVMDDRVRPTHAAINGMILPANHTFWDMHFPPWEFNCRCSVTATDELPEGYDHSNPSGEPGTTVFYDDKGMPAKLEIGTSVYDFSVQGKFQGVPPQKGLKATIEKGVKRAKQSREKAEQKIEIDESSAVGTPVSSALEIKLRDRKTKSKVQHAMDLIDRVHGDGDLPKIPITNIGKVKANGFYRYRALDGKAVDIGINSRSDHQLITATHEIGHFLDQQTIGTRGTNASQFSDVSKEWCEVVKNSDAVKALKEAYANNHVKIDSVNRIVSRAHLKYLLSENELWARSYAQFVAKKSGDAVILKELDNIRNRPIEKAVPSQWTDEDFEPIMAAIEKMFRTLGWLK